MRSGTAAGLALCLALGTVADAVEIDSEASSVVARDGETVLWKNVHDRRGQLTPGTPGGLVGPVRVGGSVYYAVGVSLYRVAEETGNVQRRFPLPAPCSKLDVAAETVQVTVAPIASDMTWTRTYEVGPDGSTIPFFLPGNLLLAQLLRQDAAAVMGSIPQRDAVAAADEDDRSKPEMKPFLETAIEDLATLAERDATNPWYRYWRGVYLENLGRGEEAQAAFQSVLDLDSAYDSELLALALPLDEVSSELGDMAFERSLRFLTNQGFEPEMMRALISLLMHYGKPAAELDPVADLTRLNHLGERIWDLAPHCEGAGFFYNALAEAHRQAGQLEVAELWQARAVEALPNTHFGFGSRSARLVGPALNLQLAALLASLLVLLVKTLRYSDLQRKAQGLARWNPFGFWTRGEIAGFLVLQALLLWAMVALSKGVVAIGFSAGLPLAAVNGNLGHPDGIEYTAQLQGSPGGDFVHALALHKGGETERAAAIYNRLELPEALNNLGVIRQASGDEAAARQLFSRAKALEPGLRAAAHNLGEAVESPRVDRATRYGLTTPLLAMPSPRTWDQALTSRLEVANPFALFGTIHQLAFADPVPAKPALHRASVFEPATLGGLIFTALILLALLGLVWRAPVATPQPTSRVSVTGWGLGLLVPGTARQLGALGPLLLAVGVFAGLVHYALVASGGLASNMIEAIALPNLTAVYGIGEILHDQLELLIRQTRHLWWILWLANLVAVLVLDRLWPDPCGPRGAGA